jgi:hypothetical protein
MKSAVRDYLAELYHSTIAGWNRFWFTPADPATLGVLRILTGAMLVYTHVVWSVQLAGFFGADGYLSVSFARQMHGTPFAWSHLYGIQSTGGLWTVHVLALLILVAFSCGLYTRWTSILAFLITVSYSHRAVGALFGLDQINGFLALYLAVGPSGDAYSVDNWRRRWQGRAGGAPTVLANLATRLIQCHMCVVYLFAGLGKLLGPSWWAGTALWGAFANLEYQTLDMTWVAGHPLLVNSITHLILFWEISYVALIWPRLTRPLMLALAVPLHLGIAVCMGMITFGLIMLVGNLAFVPPELVRRLLNVPVARRQAVSERTGGKHATASP